jgi:hypothetical protein
MPKKKSVLHVKRERWDRTYCGRDLSVYLPEKVISRGTAVPKGERLCLRCARHVAQERVRGDA